ncbi:MAG: M48 family metalloprotease [Rickettsiales bacterium]|nr:M48 family metalloprotease [Rickettsiales bacterium]
MSPFFGAIAPFTNLYNIDFVNRSVNIDKSLLDKMVFAIMFNGFLISFFMLIYLFFDLFLGFSVRYSLKKCKRYEKVKDFDFLTDIFEQVKSKFNQPNVKLYIKNSNEINAFAVSSLGYKAIVITNGMVNHYLKSCNDPKKFLYAMRSIMGHEMSHLINKDFLPGFLIMANQRATNFVLRIVSLFFHYFVRLVSLNPYGGHFLALLMNNVYSLTNFILSFFNRFIVYNLYRFLNLWISRSIEYRCDEQSAIAFGGDKMAMALSMLGKNGYFTLFSTHPNTKSRINKVVNIKIKDEIILPKIFDALSNYFSIMLLMVICLCFAEECNVDYLVRNYGVKIVRYVKNFI